MPGAAGDDLHSPAQNANALVWAAGTKRHGQITGLPPLSEKGPAKRCVSLLSGARG